MSRSLRELRRRRAASMPLHSHSPSGLGGAEGLALPIIQDERAGTGEHVEAASARTGLPASAVRAAASYYAGLAAEPGAIRVCRGTSCLLAGADALSRRLAETVPVECVYCLGWCDQSPALLTPEGAVVTSAPVDGDLAAAERGEASRSSIRCTARERIVTRRIGRGDFSSLDAARADGAYDALARALTMKPEAILDLIQRSALRGRGGAAFPTGAKWRRCAEASGAEKWVVANGDEGDPGSFIDRLLMEDDPHGVLEGLALCAWAIGAHRAIVFIRREYPEAQKRVENAIAEARDAGVFGPSVLGSGFALDVEVFRGLGGYVCGEETAMLNAIEGFRGEVRIRPPYPTTCGLFGQPTVVDNVETLVNVPWIVERGAEAYAALGTRASAGSKAICLNHGFEHPGVIEVEFGTRLRDVLFGDGGFGGGGGRGGAALEAILLGGPMGSVIGPEEWDVPVCYEAMAARTMRLGHGGIVALPEGFDARALFRHAITFMRDESCGKCVPCSIGSQRLCAMADGAEGSGGPADRESFESLLGVISETSLCAFGREIPKPLRQMIDRFGDRVFGRQEHERR